MAWMDFFKRKSLKERIEEEKLKYELETVKADIREQQQRGKPQGEGKKKLFLDGWNPDPKHLSFMSFDGGEKK